MAISAVRIVDSIRDLHAGGSNLVIEAIGEGGDFTEWEHYPADDVRDPRSQAQYYFHAHPREERAEPDYGHFHTFIWPMKVPVGIRPAGAKDRAAPGGAGNPLSHLIAISMTPGGLPERLFTTNRWVTGETWCKAPDVIAMLDRFRIDLDEPSPLLNLWLTEMLVLFRPEIEALLIERDRAIDAWQARHPDADVHEDRRLEITSSLDVSLYRHIEWLNDQRETS